MEKRNKGKRNKMGERKRVNERRQVKGRGGKKCKREGIKRERRVKKKR